MTTSVDSARLLARLRQLGNVGRDPGGCLTRLALSDGDKAGRDLLVSWLVEAGLEVIVDGLATFSASGEAVTRLPQQ